MNLEDFRIVTAQAARAAPLMQKTVMRLTTTTIAVWLASVPCLAFAQESDQYFPLDINNEWTYYQVIDDSPFEPPDTTIGIPRSVELITLDTLSYFLFDLRVFGVDTLRLDGQGNVWKYSHGGDQLFFDFTLPDGATYTYVEPELAALLPAYQVQVRRNAVAVVLAGRFENCIWLGFDIPGALDAGFAFKFAPGVGIVEWGSAWIHEWLYSASVGGTVITHADRPQITTATKPTVRIFPNPVRASAIVEIDGLKSFPVTLALYNVVGKQLQSQTLLRAGKQRRVVRIDMSGLPSGPYFLEVRSLAQRSFGKFVYVR